LIWSSTAFTVAITAYVVVYTVNVLLRAGIILHVLLGQPQPTGE